jgi:hypothetical protein
MLLNLINGQGRGVSVYATIFLVYTIILYSLHVSVIRPSSCEHIYTLEINTTDNGSIVFRMLVNLVDNGDSFLVTVVVVAVAQLAIT